MHSQITHQLKNGITIEAIDEKQYWNFYNNNFIKHDNDYLFIDIDNYYNTTYQKKSESKIFWHLIKKGEVIGIFYGEHKSSFHFEMKHSVIHKDYRRQGVYTSLLEYIITYTGQKGIAEISSTHSPANNSILIAKMKLGFVLTAMEVDPRFGMNAKLTYFHSQSALNAFKFRCGDLVMDDVMLEYSHNSFDRLCNLINKE